MLVFFVIAILASAEKAEQAPYLSITQGQRITCSDGQFACGSSVCCSFGMYCVVTGSSDGQMATCSHNAPEIDDVEDICVEPLGELTRLDFDCALYASLRLCDTDLATLYPELFDVSTPVSEACPVSCGTCQVSGTSTTTNSPASTTSTESPDDDDDGPIVIIIKDGEVVDIQGADSLDDLGIVTDSSDSGDDADTKSTSQPINIYYLVTDDGIVAVSSQDVTATENGDIVIDDKVFQDDADVDETVTADGNVAIDDGNIEVVEDDSENVEIFEPEDGSSTPVNVVTEDGGLVISGDTVNGDGSSPIIIIIDASGGDDGSRGATNPLTTMLPVTTTTPPTTVAPAPVVPTTEAPGVNYPMIVNNCEDILDMSLCARAIGCNWYVADFECNDYTDPFGFDVSPYEFGNPYTYAQVMVEDTTASGLNPLIAYQYSGNAWLEEKKIICPQIIDEDQCVSDMACVWGLTGEGVERNFRCSAADVAFAPLDVVETTAPVLMEANPLPGTKEEDATALEETPFYLQWYAFLVYGFLAATIYSWIASIINRRKSAFDEDLNLSLHPSGYEVDIDSITLDPLAQA